MPSNSLTLRAACLLLAVAAPAAWLGPISPSQPVLAKDEPHKGSVPLAEFFRGEVKHLGKGFIQLSYDFSDPEQLRDFQARVPFQAVQDIKYELERDGRVRLRGTGSMQHKAVFESRVEAEVDFTPLRNRDFGFAVTEERGSDVYTLYCVADYYFSASDDTEGPQNMVIKFLPKAARVERDGLQDWRYCGSRGKKPEIARGRTYRVSISREEMESIMVIGGDALKGKDWTSKGKEAGREIVSPMVAVYGHGADVRLDDLVIRGRLSQGFVEMNDLDMTPPPEAEDESDGPAEPEIAPDVAARIRERITGYPFPTKPLDMAKLLRDVTVPRSLRAEAVARAIEVKSVKLVPFLVEGLYAEDLGAREDSFEVFKALCRKTYSYRPNAKPEARAKSIQRINEYLKKKQADFR